MAYLYFEVKRLRDELLRVVRSILFIDVLIAIVLTRHDVHGQLAHNL